MGNYIDCGKLVYGYMVSLVGVDGDIVFVDVLLVVIVDGSLCMSVFDYCV